MASLTKYAGTVTQTTGGSYVSWSNLNNIKNNASGSWATSNGRVKGKSSSPNRPSPVSCTNFSFNLPGGAEVTGVKVTYRHMKQSYNGHVCNVPAPTISLLGVSGFSGKGSAPTTTGTTFTKSFKGSALTRTVVNSSSFGVKIDYPANTNNYEGTMVLSYVNITVSYKVPSYTVSVKKASGGYNNEEYSVECSISNKNLTSYNPTCTLSAPAGFSFKRAEGTGVASRVNNRTVTWNPKLTSKVGTSTIRLVFDVSVTYPVGTSSYTGSFSLVESLYGTSGSYSATITDRPVTEQETSSDSQPVITDDDTSPVPIKWDKVLVGEGIDVDTSISDGVAVFGFPVNENGELLLLEKNTPITDNNYDITGYMGNDYYGHGYVGFSQITFYAQEPNKFCIKVYEKFTTAYFPWEDYQDKTPLISYFFEAIPEETNLTTPNYTIMQISEEELNRLGDGYTYICQSDIKHTTTDTSNLDWYKNNRIGIFNNSIENVNDYTTLTNQQIFDNALYWSESLGGFNDYNNVECEFTYNSDYPLYVIITGDYPDVTAYGYTIGSIGFTEPVIIEKQYYEGREANGNYPIPINALISDTDSSTLTLTANETGTPVRVYDFQIDDDFGTNESYGIRGIEITGTIESSDNLVLYAKLIKPNGEIGQRSIILNTDDTDTFTIGGLGDLWGFTTLQMTNLNDWQIELSASNILGTGEAYLNVNNLQITYYLETIDKQQISIKVDGEDIAYYGAFIEAVNIPEGLETDTSFINVDGTDMNDAYRQNIKEKTITVEFNISECDIKTSTDLLRQITKLFTNTKDKYNRPIPKRIEFSHYPEDYFEYIMEKPFDTTTEIGDYNVKASLTIPAGTSYSKEDTITNTVGNANGLAPLRPIITISPTTPNIEIKEALTGQSFNMSYGGTWTNKIVEINCDDRIVLLKTDADDEGTDISKYVDHNSDWFRLSGEFQFEAVNCVIRTVSFNERW